MEKRSSFKGSIGFVLAAAGSAVGLGNIWRFPYLAAKDGGGLFVLVYIILAVTFGFALLTTEVALGRKIKLGPLSAYSSLKKGWNGLGFISCLVPMIIMPYYCVIGGWVLKYLVAFVTGNGFEAAADNYFTGFITSYAEPLVLFFIFFIAVCIVVYRGVNKGIESFSKIIMPCLVIFVIFISVFSLTISHTEVDAATGEEIRRTGLQGLKICLVPDFKGLTLSKFLMVATDAMGQLFYSLSIAMGIMVAYGSYVKDEENLVQSINQIEIFDTGVAIFAGVMIIPAVFTFMGTEGLNASGPGLMFVALPKVFKAMGFAGHIIGALFFIMVSFAALTSAVSILEAVVSSFMDEFKISRRRAIVYEGILAFVFGVLVCLGYNIFYFDLKLPNGSVGQILDIMDYLSNSFLMPIVAILTCVLIGWVCKPKTLIDEVTKNGEKFGRKNLYVVMIKFVAPVLLLVLFLKSVGIL